VNDDALVSVVLPVFDGEAYLRQSLESILAQTYRTLEVIVMDDASSDASAEIAAELARADPRVRLQRQPSNVGQFANVNAGLQLAQGEFVAVYHADDVYHPEIVAREVAYLRAHPDAAAVFTLVVLVDAAGHEFGRLDRLPPEIETAELLPYPLVLNAILRHQSSFLPTPSALVRSDVYAELGPYALDYELRGDLDMWLRIARRHPLGLIREHLLDYRVGIHNESRRYAYLRTEPDLFYTVIDQRLAGGDRTLAEPSALAAYEAHRAADLLVAARNAYVLGRRAQLRALLGGTRLSPLLAAQGGRRRRLLVLFALLHALGRLPQSAAVARLLRPRQTPPNAAQPPHARPEPKPL
jgi:cellulose synthase/poly-beta-1,6-N-acetylglucosamine synthase-like glycosyltransferase